MVLECVILQRFHRVVMGPKGYKVQQITRDHDVQIRFPERDDNPGVLGVWRWDSDRLLTVLGLALEHLFILLALVHRFRGTVSGKW